MSELMFPGGIVRIDEGEVWRKLGAWLADGERTVRMWSSQSSSEGPFLFCKLDCRTSGNSFNGSSRLGAADAVAQALQAAYAKHENTPLGD